MVHGLVGFGHFLVMVILGLLELVLVLLFVECLVQLKHQPSFVELIMTNWRLHGHTLDSKLLILLLSWHSLVLCSGFHPRVLHYLVLIVAIADR